MESKPCAAVASHSIPVRKPPNRPTAHHPPANANDGGAGSRRGARTIPNTKITGRGRKDRGPSGTPITGGSTGLRIRSTASATAHCNGNATPGGVCACLQRWTRGRFKLRWFQSSTRHRAHLAKRGRDRHSGGGRVAFAPWTRPLPKPAKSIFTAWICVSLTHVHWSASGRISGPIHRILRPAHPVYRGSPKTATSARSWSTATGASKPCADSSVTPREWNPGRAISPRHC